MENTLIPGDHVLVLGDHRGNSRDGRFFGTVPINELYGRATAVPYTATTWEIL
jgi:signal peptidase I